MPTPGSYVWRSTLLRLIAAQPSLDCTSEHALCFPKSAALSAIACAGAVGTEEACGDILALGLFPLTTESQPREVMQ